jgi:uncharacterized membrane protein
MKLIAATLGLLVAVMGLILVVAPSTVLEFGRSILDPMVIYAAAAVRVIFGAILVIVAPTSRAPKTLRVLGAILVIAGILTPVVGVDRSRDVFDWMLAQGSLFTRAWAAAAAGFGFFIAYANITSPKSVT